MDKKWLIVVAYTILILATLPWARNLWDLAGDRNGFYILAGLYICSAGFLYIRYKNIFIIGLLGSIGFAIFKLIPLPIERIHFIEYGILGWLSYWAGSKKAFLYVVTIGIIDELIQGILPNRYFDIRDIFMNVIGGCIGIFMRLYER